MKTTEQNKLSGAASAIIAQSAVENDKKAVTITINIGFILSGVAVVGVGFTAFYFLCWRNRFRPMKRSQYAANSNVPPVAAVAKANVLYEVMKGGGTDEKAIRSVLRSVNYNGYADIYNAFSKREPGGSSSSLDSGNYKDLTSFLHDDLNGKELQNLRCATAPDAAAFI